MPSTAPGATELRPHQRPDGDGVYARTGATDPVHLLKPVAADQFTVLNVVPTLDGGAADAGTLDTVRILAGAGHRAIVASRAGRLVADVSAAGGEYVPLDLTRNNPFIVMRNAIVLARLVRERRCDLIHAHGRAAAWSAYLAARITRVPFITTWYKGFREQNLFKRGYNGVMARGDQIAAVSEQLAQLIHDRYRTPWERITVVPTGVDGARFDPGTISFERVEAVRRAWGIKRNTKVILVTGRIVRRKGHHVVVRALRRLRDMGFKDFLCVFIGEDRGQTKYTGELWDLALSIGTVDLIRMAAPVSDLPAAYAAAAVVVSAAIQPEGLQRALLEAQMMARPVVVSDLATGPEAVLTAPPVPDDRVTGLRFAADDDAALAEALLRLFALPEMTRRAIGQRGRDWVLRHFDAQVTAAQTLRFYARVLGRDKVAVGPAATRGN